MASVESLWTSWETTSTSPDESGTGTSSNWTVWRQTRTIDTPINEWYVAGASWVRADLVTLS